MNMLYVVGICTAVACAYAAGVELCTGGKWTVVVYGGVSVAVSLALIVAAVLA
jgi:hypothetical protein